jgi:hypothetical protein
MALFSKLKTQIIRESVKSKLPVDLSEVERELVFGKLLENAPVKGSDGAWYIRTDGGRMVKLDRDYFDKGEEKKPEPEKKEGVK